MAIRNGQRNCAIIGRRDLLLLGLSVLTTHARAETTRAEDHESFWLWAGVEPQAALANAKQIYLLAGEVSDRGRPHIISQRSATPHMQGTDVWIVYRAQTLNWTEAIFADVLAHVESWATAGNKVVGLQIDFDSGTKHLDRYVAFLAQLREKLPKTYRLSVTGLLDWGTNGGSDDLKALGEVVDEVILQIYQGRHLVPNYQAYLAGLSRWKVPFRIGLLQGRDWRPPPDLLSNPYFKGTVLFLMNERKTPAH